MSVKVSKDEERAAEDGYRVAWLRRKARDEAQDQSQLSEDAQEQAHAGREEAQRSVEEAAEQLLAIIGRARAGRSE